MDLITVLLEGEQSNKVSSHELQSYRLADQRWELLGAHSEILLDLDTSQLFLTAFGLHRNDIVRTSFVQPDIYLICFYLTETANSRTQVVL